MSKAAVLRAMVRSSELEFLMEAHNGLSARIAEEAGFRGLWASGLAIAASLGVRDSNEASWTQVLDVLEFMSDATRVPILLDGDTGYGNFNTARRLVKKLEQRNVAGVCIEDKRFPKSNSFREPPQHALADVAEFCGKIRAMQDAKADDAFVVVARVEALIAGLGLAEALRRAEAYRGAGADAILIHSTRPTAVEIDGFMREWGGRLPVVIVPTAYASTPTDTFRALGVRMVIWANQSLRSAIAAMQATTRRIAHEQSVAAVEASLVSMAEVFRLQGEDELREAERRYLPDDGRRLDADVVRGAAEERGAATRSATPRLRTRDFGALLARHGYAFFSGVPCSYLAPLIDYASAECAYVGAVNEGDAVAHCAGARLGGRKAVVLMQNSGLTNALSPLSSLTEPFGIPVLGFVSLRLGSADEPQHAIMGRATTTLLDAIGIAWVELSADQDAAARQLVEADRRVDAGASFFFVVRKDTFDAYPHCVAPLPRRRNAELRSLAEAGIGEDAPLRHAALRVLAERRGPRTVFVNTTGFTSREMYGVDDAAWQFYMVGSLGCASALALGLALAQPDLLVVAVDGDGALLMRLGALATNGTYAPANFLHVLMNNGCHESTGGQATVAGNVDFAGIAAASGYANAIDVATADELGARFSAWQAEPTPTFLHLRTRPGTAGTLVRPALTAPAVRERLMRHVAELAEPR